MHYCRCKCYLPSWRGGWHWCWHWLESYMLISFHNTWIHIHLCSSFFHPKQNHWRICGSSGRNDQIVYYLLLEPRKKYSISPFGKPWNLAWALHNKANPIQSNPPITYRDLALQSSCSFISKALSLLPLLSASASHVCAWMWNSRIRNCRRSGHLLSWSA